MKKRILPILILMLVTSRALALDKGSFEIRVTINKAPAVESFLPRDGSAINEGDTLEISVSANDPNNDVLKYRFFINGIVKRDWGASPAFSCLLGNGDIGLNRISAEVTDGIETITTEEAEVYVFRKSLALPTAQ